MTPLQITHIGVLVADVEIARQHWSNALGTAFSPVVRYRQGTWRDANDPAPHAGDLRQTIYLGASPSIEIQQFVEDISTHMASRGEGGHHFAFPRMPDNNARRDELAALGLEMKSGVNHEGRWIIQFTDADALNNVATEWVEASTGHRDVKDDGSPVDRLPDGSTTVFDAATIVSLGGVRPPSDIVEFAVRVANLENAVAKWSAVTGHEFESDGNGEERSVVSREIVPAIRLVETSDPHAREGLFRAVVKIASARETIERLRRASVPVVDQDGEDPGHIDIDPSYLNGFSLRFADGRK
jgi:hypothetical protein